MGRPGGGKEYGEWGGEGGGRVDCDCGLWFGICNAGAGAGQVCVGGKDGKGAASNSGLGAPIPLARVYSRPRAPWVRVRPPHTPPRAEVSRSSRANTAPSSSDHVRQRNPHPPPPLVPLHGPAWKKKRAPDMQPALGGARSRCPRSAICTRTDGGGASGRRGRRERGEGARLVGWTGWVVTPLCGRARTRGNVEGCVRGGGRKGGVRTRVCEAGSGWETVRLGNDEGFGARGEEGQGWKGRYSVSAGEGHRHP